MHKIMICTLAMLLGFPFLSHADSYDALWKKVETAQEKDLPRDAMDVLSKIMAKASREHEYGQLMKAELSDLQIRAMVSPDSLSESVVRIETNAGKASGALKAVYAAVLGRIYQSRGDDLCEAYAEVSRQWYDLALSDFDVLAKEKAEGYDPLVEKGVDSELFGHDLLHVIAIECGARDRLFDYYKAHGNRRAACVSASWALKATGKARADSLDLLIAEYGDLVEAGGLATERYGLIGAGENLSDAELARQRIEYIDQAVARWDKWKGIGQLKAARAQLTQPRFYAVFGKAVQPSGQPGKVEITSACNLKELRLKIQRLNLDGDTDLNPRIKEDYDVIKQKLVPGKVYTYVKRFDASLREYEVVEDSILYDALPVGVYLLTLNSDNESIAEERALLRVSNLRTLWQELPNKQVRIAVVDAVSGQPVPMAKVRLKWYRYRKTDKTETLTCNGKGETIYKYGESEPTHIYVYTDDDKAMAEKSFNFDFGYYPDEDTHRRVNLYTDRTLYRPGQTVHVAALAYDNIKSIETKAVAHEPLTLALYDANSKEVTKKNVTTDDFGMASADFVLPSSGLTGSFSVRATGRYNGSIQITVEEYKRPTFKVEFDKVDKQYAVGDTIEVKGYARSFAGVPVQGARVRVTYSRRPAFWWYRDTSYNTTETLADSLITADDGSFVVNLPMVLPETEEAHPRRYYRFNIVAEVTDQAGETRSGATSVPLSDHPTAFTCQLPSQSLRDSLRTISFSYVNNAGVPLEGTVKYRFDDGKEYSCKANESVDVSKIVRGLSSGKHTLTAVCGTDSLEEHIVLFSYDDRHPAVETHDWFYQSTDKFPTDGSPVYIQIGSSDEQQHILYTIVAGEKLIESGCIDQSNAVNTRKFTYKDEYGDGILITYVWMKDEKVYEHEARIEKPLPDKRLLLSWTTFRDKLKPGQQEEWTLRITNPDGKPAKAQLLAALYDQSLDMIKPHSWWFNPWLHRTLPDTDWRWGSINTISFSGRKNLPYIGSRGLHFSHFDESLFRHYYISRNIDNLRASLGAAMPMESRAMVRLEDSAAADEVVVTGMAKQKKLSVTGAVKNDEEQADADAQEKQASAPDENVQMRENLSETAFFYPDLLADDKGNVAIRFTLPESVTTWKFMGLAHDKDMNYGLLGGETVAQKTVMVQPNVPRFVRAGDQAQISTRIFNTSEQAVSGTARLQLLDAATEKMLLEQEQPYEIGAKQTGSATFKVDVASLGSDQLLICRVMAVGGDYSDGEQHYLPVMPDKELVTNTYAITQHEPGIETVDLQPMLPVRDATSKLTVEYTNHPVWLLIQALPTMATVRDDNAVSLATAYYSNSIANYLLHMSPNIKQTIEQWQKETGPETSLMSSLQKNESLKNLLLNETPWVLEAENEAEQKRLLINYFDESMVNHRLETYLQKLSILQNGDGSFSWWKGMGGSPWMTATVCEQLIRLNVMLGKQDETEDIISDGIAYLSKHIKDEIKELKLLQKKHKVKYPRPSELAVDYLYICAMDGRQMSQGAQADINYLVGLLEKQTTEFSIYGKAHSALIFSKFGKAQKAAENLESIRQYTVYTKEMGRYFDTPKALYSWRDYRIPSQVAAIEALKALQPNDRQTIIEMQRWLLQEKRTQAWDTPINSVNAVFAFLQGEMDKLKAGEPSTLKLDGEPMQLPAATVGLGYVKATVPAADAQTFSVEKTSEGTSWGAVYAQFMQTSTAVDDASTGLSVTREIRRLVGGQWTTVGSNDVLHVGDHVKMRITIQADRDYDFVQLVDKRAACMEPIGQLSGYHWGYYCSPRDNSTNYYFDLLSKGKHVVETEYYVDRAGRYETGTCTVECAYSPEFSAREKAKVINVE